MGVSRTSVPSRHTRRAGAGWSVTSEESKQDAILEFLSFLYEDEQILNVAMMGNVELWRALVEHDELLANAHNHFDADRYAERHSGAECHHTDDRNAERGVRAR